MILLNTEKTVLSLFSFLVLTGFVSFSGCTSCTKSNSIATITQDSVVYAPENFSAMIIDSFFLNKIIAEDKSLEPYAVQILDFYARRNYQTAWFADTSITTQALDFLLRLKDFSSAFNDTSFVDTRLLFLTDSLESTHLKEYNNPAKRSEFDVMLTCAFFKYADREYYGTNVSIRDLEWYIPRKKKDYARLLHSLINSGTDYALTEPLSPYYKALKKSLVQYRKMEQSGGFPFISDSLLSVKPSDTSQYVRNLKAYLFITRDLQFADTTNTYNDSLIVAIERFQERMGLRITGAIDKSTIQELNTPLEKRIRQIMINLERLRWMPDTMPDNFFLVNIPEFKIHVFENENHAWSMNVVVGKEATATSIFSNRLSWVVFSPYWVVPQSIIKKELLPILKRNPGYLNRKNMEVLGAGNKKISPYAIKWSRYKDYVPYTIREKPGKGNSLGLVKFLFPNQFNIYMHDTPAKSLFSSNERAFSHGCIRLEDAKKMANYVVRNDTALTSEKIDTLMNSGEEKWVRIKPDIPVFIVYFTCWVSYNGTLNFRNDLYGHDEKLAREVFVK